MRTKIDPKILIALRKSRNWSQEELALTSGLSARTIQRIENEAEASHETKRAIAVAFGVAASDLGPRDETALRDAEKGRKAGVIGASLGYSCAFVAVTHSLFTGGINGFWAGVTLGVLGAVTGATCVAINWMYRRYARVV